jgi:UDP-N-acetylglucosamine:LPS N-acetylglucosamine transferase
MTIALIASRGGHLSQVQMLCTKEVVENRKTVLITESKKRDEKIPGTQEKTYLFEKDSLNLNPFSYFLAILRFKKIFRKEKVKLAITTGAHLAVPALVAAKMMGIKTMYIETVIRVKTPTWSGKICYFFSDIFLVQNPGMEKYYGKRTKYVGGII